MPETALTTIKKIEHSVTKKDEEGKILSEIFLIPYGENNYVSIIKNDSRPNCLISIKKSDSHTPEAYYIANKDEHFHIVEKDGKYFLGVFPSSVKEIFSQNDLMESFEWVQLPITKENCTVLEDFLNMPTISQDHLEEIDLDTARKHLQPLEYVPSQPEEVKENPEEKIKEPAEEIKESPEAPKELAPPPAFEILGNLKYQESDELSFYYLPYKDNGEDKHLRLIEFKDVIALNIETEGNKTITCPILNVESVDVDGKESLQFVVNMEGSAKVLTFPINTKENNTLVDNISKLLKKEPIDHTKIESFEIPDIKNFHDKDLTITEKPSLEQEKLVRRIKNSQSLEKSEILIGSEKFSGLKQKIDVSKLGFSQDQTFTLIDSTSYTTDSSESVMKGVLATISKNNESPVAVFVEVDGKLRLDLSKEFVDNFKSENPNVNIPEGTTENGYVSYEIDKLKLDENLTIQDIQIKAASSDFAVMFSALGFQAMDNAGNRGVSKNTDSPFDLSVSTKFVEKALQQKDKTSATNLEMPTEGHAFEAIMISAIQLERAKTAKQKTAVVSYGNFDLYSIPLEVKNGDSTSLEYLNLMHDRSSGKTYTYMHITGESSKSKTVPKFYEVDLANLEASAMDPKSTTVENPSLYLGLKSGTNSVRVNIDLDYTNPTNAESISFLKNTALQTIFGKNISETTTATLLGETKIGEKDYSIFSRSNENASKVLSLGNVAINSKVQQEMEKETLPPFGFIPDPIKREPTPPFGFVSDPPSITDPDDIPPSPKDDDSDKKDPTPPHKEDPAPDPTPPEKDTDHRPTPEPHRREPAPIHTPDEEEPHREEPEEDLDDEIKWKTKIGKEKPEKSKLKISLIGFFAFSTLLSILLPFFSIIAGILAIAIVALEVEPWKLKADKTPKTRKDKSQNRKTMKKIATLDKTKSKVVELQNMIVAGEEQKIAIRNNPKLSQIQKNKKIRDIDKKIAKQKRLIEENVKRSALIEKQIKVDKLTETIKNCSKETKPLDKHYKKILETKQKDIETFKKEREKSTEEKKSLEKEKGEREDLEFLEDKLRRGETLSAEELQKLKKLRKKFKKSKKSSSLEYDSEIEHFSIQIDKFDSVITETENEQKAVEEDYSSKKEQISSKKESAEEEKSNLSAQIKTEKRLVGKNNDGSSVSIEDFEKELSPEVLAELTDDEKKMVFASGEDMKERLQRIKDEKSKTKIDYKDFSK